MKITLKLYARLAEYLPPGAVGNQAPVELAEGASVGQVLERFGLPAAHCHLVLVNGVYIAPSERPQTALRPDDVLAVWPQVAGGGWPGG
jgi:molybdopterin synthase sulfur carrier subunit